MRTRVALLVGLVAATALVAGCLGPLSGDGADPAGTAADGPPPEDDPAQWALRAVTEGDDHDHEDPLDHRNLSTPNFDLVGYNPLATDYHGRTSGDYLCGESKSNEDRRLTAVQSARTDIAFVLVDTTDPEDPRKVGELVLENAWVNDVDLGPELDYVVLGTHPYDTGPDPSTLPGGDGTGAEAHGETPGAYWRDACTGETEPVAGLPHQLPWKSGLVLVDISDPSEPAVVDFAPTPVTGSHSLQVRELDGRSIVAASVLDSNYQTSYVAFQEIQDGPVQGQLVPLSTYQYEPVTGTDGERLGLHDTWLQTHPVTGENLAYIAYGSSGLVIVNIDDLANPEFVGHWDDWSRFGPGDDALGHYTHTVRPASTTWDGRHYTFIGEECLTPPPKAPTCLVLTLDTTDPANPKYVSFWTLPEIVPWTEQLQFSLHYVDIQDRTLFVTAYHGGMWAVDVSSSQALQEMPSIGVFVPSKVPPNPVENPESQGSVGGNAITSGYAIDNTPIVVEAEANPDGTVTVIDSMSGLYQVRFDETQPETPVGPYDVTNDG